MPATTPDPTPTMRQACGTLRERWYVACRSADLERSKPLARVILEENLVLFRDGRGEARCFVDRCLHRNAMLSEGWIEDGCLACPYHGWRYDTDGRLACIPSEGPDSKGRPDRQLDRFAVREQDDLIWVWLGDADDITSEPFRYPNHGAPGWRSYYMVTPFENDVTNCVENFMDVPHTISVHAGWFRSKASKAVRTDVERTDDSVLVTYHQDEDTIGWSTLIFNPRREPVKHTDKFFMPNVTRVDYEFGSSKSFIITSQCTPVGPMKTMVYTAITFRMGVLNPLGRLFLPPYTRKVIQQDVEIMANQGASLKRYGRSFQNSAADVIHTYIESLRDWAEAGEPGAPPKPAKTEITFYI